MTIDISKALELWVKITGVNPNATSFRLGEMDIRQSNEILKKSLSYDSTYTTTLMLLDVYLNDFLENRSLSYKEIIEEYDTVTGWLQSIHQMKNILQSEEVMEIKETFKEHLKEAIRHYGIEEEMFESILNRDGDLAEIRYSAFHAMEKLEINQFSHGQPSKNQPKIYRDVYRFTDVNTLLRWMMRVESGIVLGFIQDPCHLSSSYFVFAIRNGGNLTLVSDRTKTTHPLQQMMSRSRATGREFYNRITQFHFPYSVMDIEFGDNHRAYVNSQENGLDIREDGVAIKEMKHLRPSEIAWLMIMFNLLHQNFFEQNYQAETLSYTAKMMKESQLLIEEAEKKGIMIQGYQPLIVPSLTEKNVKTKKVEEYFEKHKPTGQHDWMIDRYAVPNETFDVLSEGKLLLLTDQHKKEQTKISLKKMNPSDFGDAKRLEQDRIYLARYNQAMVINQKVKEEYDEKEEEIRKWFKEAVTKNLPQLLKAMAKGEFLVSNKEEETYVKEGGWLKKQPNGNIFRIGLVEQEGFYGFNTCLIRGQSSEYSKTTCVLQDTKASIVGHFHPTKGNMLADLCGMKVSELPLFLQDWRKEKKDTANCILDRVDPMDWAIINPWQELNLEVRIFLSKRGYNKLCKEHKTGNENFWDKKTIGNK